MDVSQSLWRVARVACLWPWPYIYNENGASRRDIRCSSRGQPCAHTAVTDLGFLSAPAPSSMQSTSAHASRDTRSAHACEPARPRSPPLLSTLLRGLHSLSPFTLHVPRVLRSSIRFSLCLQVNFLPVVSACAAHEGGASLFSHKRRVLVPQLQLGDLAANTRGGVLTRAWHERQDAARAWTHPPFCRPCTAPGHCPPVSSAAIAR